MNRILKLFAALMPISLICAQHGTAGNPQMNSAYEIHRQRAVQMNELAGKVQSPDDSRRWVDMIAEMFATICRPRGVHEPFVIVSLTPSINPRSIQQGWCLSRASPMPGINMWKRLGLPRKRA